MKGPRARWNGVKRRGLAYRWNPLLLTALGTIAALSPVVWLALGGFYWSHYAQPGYGYLPYNLARLWTMILMLLAFWATGSRIIGYAATARDTSQPWTDRFIESAFCGAAAWSVGVVFLAMLHLYYVWVILPLVALAAALAITDLATTRGDALPSPETSMILSRWGLVGLLLRLAVLFNATALLLTIALWGNPGPDNDVPGTYLPYYETVLRTHVKRPQ